MVHYKLTFLPDPKNYRSIAPTVGCLCLINYAEDRLPQGLRNGTWVTVRDMKPGELTVEDESGKIYCHIPPGAVDAGMRYWFEGDERVYYDYDDKVFCWLKSAVSCHADGDRLPQAERMAAKFLMAKQWRAKKGLNDV